MTMTRTLRQREKRRQRTTAGTGRAVIPAGFTLLCVLVLLVPRFIAAQEPPSPQAVPAAKIQAAIEKLGDLDITALILNDDTGTNDPFFRWDGDLGRWIYHLRTAGLEEGRYTLRVRIASRKEYNAGFILESED
jgi:hypothetical protein